jgi:hypothetical protein
VSHPLPIHALSTYSIHVLIFGLALLQLAGIKLHGCNLASQYYAYAAVTALIQYRAQPMQAIIGWCRYRSTMRLRRSSAQTGALLQLQSSSEHHYAVLLSHLSQHMPTVLCVSAFVRFARLSHCQSCPVSITRTAEKGSVCASANLATANYTIVDFAQLPETDCRTEPWNIFKDLRAEDCERCKQRSSFLERRKINNLQKSDKSRDLMDLGQACIVGPATSTCRACDVLWSLVQGILDAYSIVRSSSIALEWNTRSSQLIITGPNHEETRVIQVFVPRGEPA